jgi:uncharacterized protein
MSTTSDQKFDSLKRRLRDTGGLAVAFSGGVDSTFLAATAYGELGDRALAVTAVSPLYPEHEQKEAVELARKIGISHEIMTSNELDVPGFADNPPNRCYLCKSELFEEVRQVAAKHGIDRIADGSNADDQYDYRPGRQAAAELGVLSPLADAGLGKDEIRQLSKKMNLPTADKPAFACLASRFPYGSRITEEGLAAVDALESELRKLGFRQFRVRHHGNLARIEVDRESIQQVCDTKVREQLLNKAKESGFSYVAVDLEGYRTGSMNETLDSEQP